jgi:hypothetical protein
MINPSEINKLKSFIYPNGKYSNIRSNSASIKKYFPGIYEEIKDNYKTKLYMLLQDVKEIPMCKNPECNNRVKLKNIGAGFRKYCCNKCIGQYQKIDDEFAKKISIIQSKKGKYHLKNKYPNLNIKHLKNRNFILISNYCKHGDIILHNNKFSKLYKLNISLCIKCQKEIFNAYLPSEEDIMKFQKNFDIFYKKNSLAMREKWFIQYYPKEYKIILEWSKNIRNISLAERIYLFKNNLKDIPKCKNPKCNNKSHFNLSTLKYTEFCKSYKCQKNISSGEIEVYEFVKKYSKDAKQKFYINKNEYDIIIPSRKFLIEFNGLYWHSDRILSNPKYHIDKMNLAISEGFQLFNIWEDDWYKKTNIVKSILKNKLGKTPNKIYARRTKIREISSSENKIFFGQNHLQGSVSASIRYGLFYNGELISAMTFGKKRNVLGQSSIDNEYELLRFANKIDTNVIGGASKLFVHFIKDNNPNKVISYANCDISNGNLYRILGFKEISHTGINYWWAKDGTKYHRAGFQKYKLVKAGFDPLKTENEIMNERDYFRIYGTGNLKYEWVKP